MGAAARGLRRTDSGVEPIADPDLRCALRERGSRLWLYTNMTAIAATAAVVALP